MNHHSTTRAQHGLYQKNRNRDKKTNRLERVRLIQFMICLLLTLTLFIGRGVFPGKMAELRSDILSFMSRDLDVSSALSRLGDSLSDRESSLGDFGAFCAEVFGPKVEKKPVSQEGNEPYFNSSIQLLNRMPLPPGSLAEQYPEVWSDYQAPSKSECEQTESQPDSVSDPIPEPSAEKPAAVPAAGTVLLKADYAGKELPHRFTMDHISLGPLETVNPVNGRLTSPYGYRDHPISGLYSFHGGTDIGCPMGTPIGAFASGTVDYIGEDDAFGKYLQLDHGNGVKSFYAHCSKVYVHKGQNITMGETVAEVGSTGTSTGPHLHLELKYNGTNLNPAYYITFVEQP